MQAEFDLSTLEVIASSHTVRTQLEAQEGALAFHFENILLPDSIVDEANSHGYVTFKIKPKSDIQDGTTLLNTAYIYFDFNPAIQTNYTMNTMVDQLPSNTDTTIVVTSCNSYTAPDNQVYSTSGIYTAVIPSSIGCDSVITIDLTLSELNTDVSMNGTTIEAVLHTGATYQWLDCNNDYAVIPGATNPSFNANENGSYAVEITINDCVDTSSCVQITTVGIPYNPIFNGVSIYPNPTNSFFTVELGSLEKATVTIYGYDGKLIKENVKVDHQNSKVELGQHSGVYLVEINSQEHRKVFRIIKL